MVLKETHGNYLETISASLMQHLGISIPLSLNQYEHYY